MKREKTATKVYIRQRGVMWWRARITEHQTLICSFMRTLPHIFLLISIASLIYLMQSQKGNHWKRVVSSYSGWMSRIPHAPLTYLILHSTTHAHAGNVQLQTRPNTFQWIKVKSLWRNMQVRRRSEKSEVEAKKNDTIVWLKKLMSCFRTQIEWSIEISWGKTLSLVWRKI